MTCPMDVPAVSKRRAASRAGEDGTRIARRKLHNRRNLSTDNRVCGAIRSHRGNRQLLPPGGQSLPVRNSPADLPSKTFPVRYVLGPVKQ